MMVLREGAVRLGAKHLANCDLYVTLEPCAMCAAAIGLARLRRLYFGAYDSKGGAVEHGPRLFDQSSTNHRPEIYGGIEERKAGEAGDDANRAHCGFGFRHVPGRRARTLASALARWSSCPGCKR